MKVKNHTWRAISRGFLAAVILPVGAPADELAPDAPSIAGSLGAWFRDAGNTFDTATGVWADSSGNERHAVPVGEVNVNGPITYLAPTLTTISSDGLGGDDLSAVHFASDVEDLLACVGINGGSSLSDLTIFVVFNVNPLAANASNVRPVGIGSVAATQRGGVNYFNLGSDPSIRKDNGNLGANQYSLAFPYETTFIRTARMSADAIDDWFNLDGTPQLGINLTGVSYVTSTDDFFIGDLRAGVSVIPGVVGATSAQADFDVAQTIVYTSALTDDQVVSVNEWLSNNPSGTSGGGAGDDLAITQITLAEDNSSVTLTWRSKRDRKYAIDLSYDLQEGNWQELEDSIDSDGEGETKAIAPTFSSPEPPEPLPDRAYFRVRELPSL